MIALERKGPPVVWGEGYGRGAGPLTWRPVVPHADRPAFLASFALATCANRHECALSPQVHSVAADGTVHPSYVCPVDGCGFHEFVRLEGWTP